MYIQGNGVKSISEVQQQNERCAYSGLSLVSSGMSRLLASVMCASLRVAAARWPSNSRIACFSSSHSCRSRALTSSALTSSVTCVGGGNL